MFIRNAFVTLLLLAPVAAHAVVPLVNPVVVPLGSPAVHLTPVDQLGSPIPIAQCTLINAPATIATVTYDTTGAILTAVGTGSATTAQWKCVNGSTTVNSTLFAITVPWSVTAVGDTLP